MVLPIWGGEIPPSWAYPVKPPDFQPTPDDGTLRRVPGSSATFTLTQLRDLVPIDALPAVPADGKRTVLREEGGAWFLDLLELRPRLSPAPIELVRQEIRVDVTGEGADFHGALKH